MNKLITAPNELQDESDLTLFLAGGISNCPDWQKDVIDLISKNKKFSNITLINPRRYNWNMKDSDTESIKQIQWEHKYITDCDYILFWFPKETLCPITLFELGAALRTKENVFIGVHPEYQRKLDVIEQTRLVRPDIKVHHSISELISNIEIERRIKLTIDDIVGSSMIIHSQSFNVGISVYINNELEKKYQNDFNVSLEATFNEDILNEYLKTKSINEMQEIYLHFGTKQRSNKFGITSNGNPILELIQEYPFIEFYMVLTPKNN